MDLIGKLRAVLSATFIIVNNIYGIPTYLIWMWTLRPLVRVAPALYWWLEGTLFRWLLLLASNWLWMAGYYIQELGDDISQCLKEESLVLINHQSTGDVVTLMHALQNKGTVSNNVCWIMDHIFKYTNFGWVSSTHGDFFIQQGKESRDQQITLLKDHLLKVYLPRRRQWLMLFPEGGFLRKRRANSQKYAKKHGFPVLEHVTLPRIGAMHEILKTLAPEQHLSNGNCITENKVPPSDHSHRRPLKWVIDITIGYPDRRPLDLFQVLFGSRDSCTTTLYYRKYPVNEVPLDEDRLLHWMYDRYEEKEHFLEAFYKTDRFPVESDTGRKWGPEILEPKRIELSAVLIWSLHGFFLLSSYFHYYLLSTGALWIGSWLS